MNWFPSSAYREIIRALRRVPEALVIVALVMLGTGAMVAGVDPWPLAAMVCVLYLLYNLRQFVAERHKTRIAELAAERKGKSRPASSRRRLSARAPTKDRKPQ